MPLYAVTLLVCASPDEVESVGPGHRGYLSKLRSLGQLRLAGAFTNGDGFIQIYSARDRMEAESIIRSNPLIEAGLASWMLREWVEQDLE